MHNCRANVDVMILVLTTYKLEHFMAAAKRDDWVYRVLLVSMLYRSGMIGKVHLISNPDSMSMNSLRSLCSWTSIGDGLT